jgi:hypothetical protein
MKKALKGAFLLPVWLNGEKNLLLHKNLIEEENKTCGKSSFIVSYTK